MDLTLRMHLLQEVKRECIIIDYRCTDYGTNYLGVRWVEFKGPHIEGFNSVPGSNPEILQRSIRTLGELSMFDKWDF